MRILPVVRRDLTFAATDAVALSGTWFEPEPDAAPPTIVTVIVCGS